MAKQVPTTCLECGTFKQVKNGVGKFCSNKCQLAWQRENVKKPLFLEGKLKMPSNGGLILHFLSEIDGRCCNHCKNFVWNDQPIPLDIDHVDGDNKNNMPNNLRLLCPNCHRQTETWGNCKFQRAKKLRD